MTVSETALDMLLATREQLVEEICSRRDENAKAFPAVISHAKAGLEMNQPTQHPGSSSDSMEVDKSGTVENRKSREVSCNASRA